MSYMANRVTHFGTTIFTEMTALAIKHNAINLGQGFPDFAAPMFLKEAASHAILADINQYAPGNGRSTLRNALAQKMQTQYDMEIDPNTQINVVVGATEAIMTAILGLVNPGEEVILFEPYYDSYVPSVEFAGGIPKYYTLRQPDWAIDKDKLEALFSDNTKIIVVNTPHNPTGKVYSQAELQLIADLCQKYDVIAVTDEVYEHILFDGRIHIPLATLPNMAERTVTISSLGKTFSVTGWKVGWTIAPPALSQAIFRAHQFNTFSGAAPLQEAAVTAVSAPNSYYAELAQTFQAKRDLLVQALTAAKLPVIPTYSTYFVMVDISNLGFANDVEFCRHLTKEVGVAAIPPSAFYHNPTDGAGLARFAFCKEDATLYKAAERLQNLE